jgi:hypothetical protein
MLSDAPAWVFLFISIAVAALPAALLLILRALFSWRYRITVDHYMGQRSAGPPASAGDTCSLMNWSLLVKESPYLRLRASRRS